MARPEASQALWQDGWYRFARALPSPNHGARPDGTTVDLIVVHTISLPPGQFGGDEVLRFFTNQLDWDAHPWFEQIRGMEVSAHFFIRRHGELWQFVSCDDRAWHAGQSTHLGRANCNDFSIGIELEGVEDGPFEPLQYETLARLCATIDQRYPIRHVTGHEDIAPGRKTDPGSGFDWSVLHHALGGPPPYLPSDIAAKKTN